jgi:hypothetical protein
MIRPAFPAALRTGLRFVQQWRTFTADVGCVMRMSVLLCLLAVPLAASAQQADQDEPAAQEPRETRTIQFPNGSTIRYEVLPGDDQIPAGELIVMHFDKPVETPAARPEPARAESAKAEQPPAAAQAAPRKETRDRCSDQRGKLIGRLLQLRGLEPVDPQFALWIDRNLHIGNGTGPAFQFSVDPLFLTALKSDTTAYYLAADLAQCEGVPAP